MKKIFLSFIQVIFISSISIAPVYAQVTVSPTTPRAALRQQNQATKETNLKSRADEEITRRITALNNLITRISTVKHLTDAQKNTFTSEIQTEITTLTTLKSKIDADTDVITLRADVQSIVKEYRVFAVFMPQLQIIAAADKMLNITDILTTVATALQTRITNAKNAQDVTTLQTTLTDMQAKIADSKTQANNAITAVSGLTPTGYPGNASTLQSARKMLQAARLDLVAARKDAETIIQSLRSITKSPTQTPTPTK